jgi:hypothetical protein
MRAAGGKRFIKLHASEQFETQFEVKGAEIWKACNRRFDAMHVVQSTVMTLEQQGRHTRRQFTERPKTIRRAARARR